MARAADAKIGKGEVGPLEGMPLGIKDLFCTKGVRTTAGSNILDGFMPPYESTVTAQLWRDGAVMLGKLNMRRVRHGLVERDLAISARWSIPGGARSKSAASGDRRHALVPGGSSGGSAAAVAADLCLGATAHRHRRLDPPAGGVHRHRRHQADLWPLLALGHRRVRLVARPGGADGRTVRDAAILLRAMAGHDPKDFDLASTCRCRTYEAAIGKIGQGHADRHPEGIPRRRHAGRDRAAVGARAAEWLQGGGRRDRRGHRCRTPNTRCRPTTSSRRRRPRPTSRAMTACATACACRAQTSIEMYENTPRRRLRRARCAAAS